MIDDWFTFKNEKLRGIKQCISLASTATLPASSFAKDFTPRNNLLSTYVYPLGQYVTLSHIRTAISASGYLMPALLRLTLQICLMIL